MVLIRRSFFFFWVVCSLSDAPAVVVRRFSFQFCVSFGIKSLSFFFCESPCSISPPETVRLLPPPIRLTPFFFRPSRGGLPPFFCSASPPATIVSLTTPLPQSVFFSSPPRAPYMRSVTFPPLGHFFFRFFFFELVPHFFVPSRPRFFRFAPFFCSH